jgi:hypothetical protein
MTSAGASSRWSWTKTICLDYVRLPRWLVNSGDRWAGRLADVLLPLIRRSGPVMREDVMRRRPWEVKCRGSIPLARARAATIRRDLIAVAARTARHGRGHLTLHLPDG